MINIGATLQHIRKDKKYTQAQLAQNIMTQGAYSKIEKSQLSINAEQLIPILSRLNIRSQEFSYVLNNYQLDPRETLIHAFTTFEIANTAQLHELLANTKAYLKNTPDDFYIQSMQTVYEAFLLLHEPNQLEQARVLIFPIWHSLQQLDDWYINDFELLNVILFAFPFDIAVEITKTALRRLEKYEQFPFDITHLPIYFRIDLSFHYIEQRKFSECLQWLDETERLYLPQMKPKTAALLFERKALCLFYLERPYEQELSKIEQLLTIYNDEETKLLLMQEFQVLTGSGRK